jgi:hypothetical protein
MTEINARQSILYRFRFPVTSFSLSNWEKAALALMRTETTRQLALTALALKRYQLKHGRSPDELAHLVPEFLPAMPRDYMNGNPLIYRRMVEGRFTLYSVGENAKDEEQGGDDLIWPAPESVHGLDNSSRP